MTQETQKPGIKRDPVREAEAVRLYTEEQLTLQEIGDRFGVTRECVRLWLKAANVSKIAVSDRTSKREQTQVAELVGRRDEMRALYFDSGNIHEFTTRLGVSGRVARAVVGQIVGYDEWRLAKSNGADRTSDERLGEYLRQAAAEHKGPLTHGAYNAIAALHGWPSHQTLMLRWGTWSAACAANNVTCGVSLCKSYTRRWTTDACWTSLRSIVQELGRVPTYQEYETLSRSRDDMPSGSMVRMRIGSWKEVIRALSAQL